MKQYPLAIFPDHPEVHFEHRTAARLAKVSEEFIHRCEREDLVTSRIMVHGKRGLCCTDVFKLKIIRHLHEDMGLDLEAVDFVLRYRNRIQKLKRRLDDMKRQMRRKEAKYLSEIRALRRQLSQLSQDGD
jgi:cell division septum initiation protein DivIVA